MAQRFNTEHAMELIAAERERQIEKKGFTPEHDDTHSPGTLAMAAACYAAPIPIFVIEFCGDGDAHGAWPFAEDCDITIPEDLDDLTRLIRAGACIVAEIERHLRERSKSHIPF